MSSSQLNASLLRLKLLDALRSGEVAKVEAIISELSSTKSTIQNTDIIQLKETILHYTVQVAPLSIIQYLVSNSSKFGLDINSQDQDGNTPLHLAVLSSRIEVIKYLLSLPNINDTIVNLKKKQPVELCKDINIIQLMQFERAKFVETSSINLRKYFSTRDFKNLEKLLIVNARASELLDINGTDPTTGNTVLHEFIKKDDLEMCDWILKHGGDPFKRDKRGKLPIDLIQGKNDPLKKLLKLASKDQNIMDPVVNTSNAIKSGSIPTYKGYLRKWTNFAQGYKLRYFVLDQNGIFSYYTNQDDTNNACRGSLNLGFANLHLDSSEKLKFEIIGKNGMRWHLKANHSIETNRWVWTLQNAITLAKDSIKRKGTESREESKNKTKNIDDSKPAEPKTSSESIDEYKKHHLHIPGRRKHKRNTSTASLNSQSDFEDNPNTLSRSSTFSKQHNSTNLSQIKEKSLGFDKSNDDSFSLSQETDLDNDYDLDDDYESDDSTGESSDKTNTDEVSTVKRSLDVEILSLIDLFNQVVKDSQDKSAKELEICSVGISTLSVIQDLVLKYTNLVQTNDEKLAKKLDRQFEVNKLWENSIRQLEDEIGQREAKLVEFEGKKKQLKKFLSSKSGQNAPVEESLPKGPSSPEIVPSGELVTAKSTDTFLDEILNDSDEEEFFDADEFEEQEAMYEEEGAKLNEEEAKFDEEAKSDEEASEEIAEPPRYSHREAKDEAPPDFNELATELVAKDEKPTDVTLETPSETYPPEKNKDTYPTKTPSERQPKLNAIQSSINSKLQEEGSFLGYENPPRRKLALDEDNRPKVGLFGILKSMIGKDMTRMTLPVSFNEPTSLVQRLAEDIEYTHLLDTAAGYEDSTLRMIYVATFAASEYASTINRIAKPFNPLLGETFEYSRPDQNYRLFVEQVSHHPPISACSAESPKWDYYGENAVDSQFKGRSFDFKHLGKMFCSLRPDNGVVDKHGKKVDHEVYSWKKVNTSVVGIMLGNPTIDNFGKMTVTNHTTGDSIVVDLKQRGWRASSAYQLSGQSLDAKGTPQWAMKGHWNSKIFAKKIDDNAPDPLNEELTNSKLSKDPLSGGKFLVWQAAPRPKVPFNLTTFAITLNGVDEKLEPWLAPTDTRLRPDQRAMENGLYDLASDEKHRVEVKQREARKKRDQEKVAYKPNWFVKSKHPVTGDSFWEFKGEYWMKRRDRELANAGDIF